MSNQRLGGTFAPPLTDELLASYRSLKPTDGPVGDALETLLKCVEKWWELPESQGTAVRRHPVGVGTIVPLEQNIADALWDLIPWDHELNAIQSLFDTIDATSSKPLRDAAFHLLWFVKELNNDREPMTNDLLG